MNNKLIKASLAGIAAIAVTAGGSTFASWSDFGTINDNEIATGVLKLNLNDGNGNSAAAPLDFGHFAPGEGWATEVWIASSDGNSVPDGNLSLTVQNIRDFENGCGSSKSEAEADATCATGDAQTLGGELSPALGTDIYSWVPKVAGKCSDFADGQPSTSVVHSSTLKSVENSKRSVGKLQKGQGLCVRIEQYLPKTATNAVQSDSVNFDLRFDLEQV